MGELGGPKSHEVFSALGPHSSSAGKVVQTPVQSGRATRADKEADRQNLGFSGTPLWKVQEHTRREAARAALEAANAPKVPLGFEPFDGKDLFWSDKRRLFWQRISGKFLVKDPKTGILVPVHEAEVFPVVLKSGASCQDGLKRVRHVVVQDLTRAANVLRMPIDHLDRPCSLFALFDGQRGPAKGGNACAEFCARHLHEKLLARLSDFRGSWSAQRFNTSIHEVFAELDAEFTEKHSESDVNHGCSAAVALLMGQRVVLASVGDVTCILAPAGCDPVELIKPHILADADAQVSDAGVRRLARAFGHRDWKLEEGSRQLTAVPDVGIVPLQSGHQGLALICRGAFDPAGGSVGVASELKRWAGQPRMASGSLIDKASPDGLAAIVAFLDVGARPEAPSEASGAPPSAKRPRTGSELGGEKQQVRLRHVLVKHRDCKIPTDKVRNRPVTRTRAEAERALRQLLAELQLDPKQRSQRFGQRCRELSECPSCLKGGDLVGDLDWVRKGKMGAAFDEAAFMLQVGQLSDLVDSDAGIHVLWRTA